MTTGKSRLTLLFKVIGFKVTKKKAYILYHTFSFEPLDVGVRAEICLPVFPNVAEMWIIDRDGQAHSLTGSQSRRLTVSQAHGLAGSRSRRLTVSQAHGLAGSRSRRLMVSQAHGLAGSRSCRLTVSQTHGLTVSQSRRLTVSQTHGLAGSRAAASRD